VAQTEWKLAYRLSLTKSVDRLRCFVTKRTFFEDVLGVGVNFTVNPKTKEVDYIALSQDLLSSTAFERHKIRSDAFGNAFQLFLPLYFTDEHFRRALPLIRKTIVALHAPGRVVGKTTTNRRHDPIEDMVLNVLPKIVNTFAVLLSDEGISASEKSFAGLHRVHRLFLALAHEYPRIKSRALARLRAFSSDEENRTKKSCPSLGSILPLLMVVDEQDFAWNRLRSSYIVENFDRGVLWTCKQHPEMDSTVDESAEQAEARVAKTFSAMTISLRLCMFHVYFFHATCTGTTSQQRARRYDQWLGRHDPEDDDVAYDDDNGPANNTMGFSHFRSRINHVLSVTTWHGFFAFVGLQCPPTQSDMARRLRLHVKNSRRKQYHQQGMDFSRVHASGTSQVLTKGQHFSAASGLRRVVFTNDWSYAGDQTVYLDATCLVYKGKERWHTVDYSNTHVEDGAIRHSGDMMRDGGGTHTIHIDLNALDEAITSCIFVISAYANATLNDILSPSIAFTDADATNSTPLCTYDLAAQDKVSYLTSVVMCKLYRAREGGWHVQAIGDAHKGAADNYGPIHKAADKLV
jgi:stress response protein SCP2